MCALIQLIDFRMRFPLGGKIIMETVSCDPPNSLSKHDTTEEAFPPSNQHHKSGQKGKFPSKKMRLIIISLSLPPNLSPLFSRMTSTANQNTLSHLLPHLTSREDDGEKHSSQSKISFTTVWSFSRNR